MNTRNWYQRAMQGLNAQNNKRFSYANGGENANLPSGRRGLTGPERVFGLIATSTTDAASTAILFGLARYGVAQSSGSGSGIAITGIGAVGHIEMKYLTSYTPYELLEIRLRANAAATIPATITLGYRTAGGSKTTEVELTPRTHQGSTTQAETRAEIPVDGVRIDASFYFSASIAGNGTLDVYFIARKVIDITRAFDNEDVVNTNYEPAPPVGPAQRLVVESGMYNKAVR